ncbi:MAG: nuclear transport factor 2 family protein [Bacteroidota bacterium]
MGQKLENAKKLYLEGIRDGHYEEAVNAYTGARYTQHSTGVKDGKEGFIEFFSEFVARNPKRDIQIVRGWEDGEYVFVQAYQNINEGEAEWVTTDFFHTDENDKIIEHWDVITKFHPSTPSGHTSVDGPTEVVDLDKTEENKALVRNLIEQALMPGGDPTRLGEFISEETYIQHNPEVADGFEHFYKLATMPNPPLTYSEIVLLVGQGNFVATLSKANWNDGKLNQDYAQVDIFRVENGKVVEHWDNVEPVPEVNVNGGKF